MTIGEARSAHPDLHRDPARDGQGAGSVHYDWPASGAGDVPENVLLADGEGDAALVVSYSLDLTATVSGSEDLLARLSDRWGTPEEPEGMERILIVAKWIDAACDVEAQLRTIARRDDPRAPARLVVVVTSLAARQRLIDRKETERERRADEQPW